MKKHPQRRHGDLSGQGRRIVLHSAGHAFQSPLEIPAEIA
jgi:hypothetical protein